MQVIVVLVRRALTKPLHASTMRCKTFALAAFVRFPPSICLDNSGKILRVVLSQLDKRAVSEGVGKRTRIIFSSASLQLLMTDSTADAVIM